MTSGLVKGDAAIVAHAVLFAVIIRLMMKDGKAEGEGKAKLVISVIAGMMFVLLSAADRTGSVSSLVVRAAIFTGATRLMMR